MPLALLENIVLEDFNQLLKTMPSLEMLVRESIPEKRGKSGCGEESVRLREELLRLREKKRALYEDYQDGLITREEFVPYQEDYRKKEKKYEKRLEAASQRQKSFAGVGLQENAWLKTVTETGRAERLNREMVVAVSYTHLDVYKRQQFI